jgi:carbon monoxide dehydrogenase subunit G
MKVQRIVQTDKPLTRVFDYLSDFTTTTDWDPGTVSTVREQGDGGVGTTYRNTSEFMGRRTELRYVVQELVPGQRIRLRGENKTVISVDTMTFRPAGNQTEVTYSAEFGFKGPVRYLAPLLRPALNRLGDHAADGLRQALAKL